MRKLRIVPDVVQPGEHGAISASANVYRAALEMAARETGGLAVHDDADNLAGILTEGDIARRLVAAGLDPNETSVAQVMTACPDTLRPDDTAADALELMRIRGLTHIPVVDGGKTAGIVSVLDLCRVVSREMNKGFEKAQADVFDSRDGG